MNQPATIKASQWHEIADAVKRGEVTARDGYAWTILEQVHEMPLAPDYLEFREQDTDSSIETFTQHVDDIFYLAWHTSQPSATDALLQTILKGLNAHTLTANGYCIECGQWQNNEHLPNCSLVPVYTALSLLRAKVVEMEAERDKWRQMSVEMHETLQKVVDKHHVNEALPGRGGEYVDKLVADYVDYIKQS